MAGTTNRLTSYDTIHQNRRQQIDRSAGLLRRHNVDRWLDHWVVAAGDMGSQHHRDRRQQGDRRVEVCWRSVPTQCVDPEGNQRDLGTSIVGRADLHLVPVLNKSVDICSI